MSELDKLKPKKFKASTSMSELMMELQDGITTSMFRVGTPDDPEAPTVFQTYFPPGYEVPPHTHACDYAEIILEGSQQVTRKWHKAGDVRIVKAGTVYGPLVAGPEGAKVLLIFSNARFSPIPVGDKDSASFERYGVERLQPAT